MAGNRGLTNCRSHSRIEYSELQYLGSDKILRERLLRAQTRLILGEVLTVPWMEKYDAADSEYIFVSEGIVPRLDNIPEEEISASRSELNQEQKKVGDIAESKQSDVGVLLSHNQEEGEAAIIKMTLVLILQWCRGLCHTVGQQHQQHGRRAR